MTVLPLFLGLWPVLAGQQAARRPSDKIEKEELSAYLAKRSECQGAESIHLWMMEPHDFLGKGHDQVVVVASTCMTGTAGPDVHSVFTRDARGELQESEIEEVKLQHRVLFGNSNSTFRMENDMLVEIFSDTSDRKDPLVIRYKWDPAKNRFTAASVTAAKPYPTSYDCAKAEAAQDETAQAICYVKSLADLDIELARAYKAYLEALAPPERKKAIGEAARLAGQEKCRRHNLQMVGGLSDRLIQGANRRTAAADSRQER